MRALPRRSTRWLPTNLLALLLLGCSSPSGPATPEFWDIAITVIGRITWADGSPIAGATIAFPVSLLSQGEAQTMSGSDGSYTLTFQMRCTPGESVFNVNVRLPGNVANNGGSCVGASTCSAGPHRRDCVFDPPGAG